MHNTSNDSSQLFGLCSGHGWVLNVDSGRFTSLRSQPHSIGQNRQVGVVKEAGARQVHLWGLKSKLLQLLGQQTKLFTLAATLLLQVSDLWLHITPIPSTLTVKTQSQKTRRWKKTSFHALPYWYEVLFNSFLFTVRSEWLSCVY